MPTDDDKNRRTESRRILDRVSKEADSSGFAHPTSGSDLAAHHDAVREENDPIDAWATKVGRTLGFIITVALMGWLVLYALGKV